MTSWFKPQSSGSEHALLEILKDQNERLTKETEWLQRRVETLTTQILAMKKDGYQWTPPVEAQAQGQQMDERIMAAIRSRAKPGSTMERDLYDYAQGLLVMDGEVEDIVDHILAGAEVDI